MDGDCGGPHRIILLNVMGIETQVTVAYGTCSGRLVDEGARWGELVLQTNRTTRQGVNGTGLMACAGFRYAYDPQIAPYAHWKGPSAGRGLTAEIVEILGKLPSVGLQHHAAFPPHTFPSFANDLEKRASERKTWEVGGGSLLSTFWVVSGGEGRKTGGEGGLSNPPHLDTMDTQVWSRAVWVPSHPSKMEEQRAQGWRAWLLFPRNGVAIDISCPVAIEWNGKDTYHCSVTPSLPNGEQLISLFCGTTTQTEASW